MDVGPSWGEKLFTELDTYACVCGTDDGITEWNLYLDMTS